MSSDKFRRIPGQTVTCGWCGTRVELKSTGRVPKWCSETCRHRAWEQRRSAASDRAPVEVVDHVVEVEKQVRVVERVEVPVPQHPRRGEWPAMLQRLAAEIDSGRVYIRDLDAIDEALGAVRESMGRQSGWVPRHFRRRTGPVVSSSWLR
ncbi:hypothetical protein [Nocardioides aurantiacus]|uniref:hypothetical protein n=1 Tax=Nocardioides aurantiacus TaxID=86796 RepID=UPI00403F450C